MKKIVPSFRKNREKMKIIAGGIYFISNIYFPIQKRGLRDVLYKEFSFFHKSGIFYDFFF